MPATEFSEFFRKMRIRSGITQKEMADKLGLSAPYITEVETGKKKPLDGEKLKQICEILKLTDREKDRMYDLAGQERNGIAEDIPEYLNKMPYAKIALRTARNIGVGEDEWKKIVEEMLKKRGIEKNV
jgi:transcriptional regulator with XRE-family HTH domain